MVLQHISKIGFSVLKPSTSPSLFVHQVAILAPFPYRGIVTSSTSYAARAGTREKRRAMKKKKKEEVVVKEEKFVPYKIKLAQKNLAVGPRRYNVDYWLKSSPVDDVWCKAHYPRKHHDTIDAIEMHREAHHPTMLNAPDSLLNLRVELDLKLAKKNKYLDNFSGILAYPYYFDRGSVNRVIAFCKNEDDATKATEAGAIMSGGKQLIQQIVEGVVTPDDFDHVVATPDILVDLITIRGILRRNFPSAQRGSLGPNVAELVEHFLKGYSFKSNSDEFEPDFGWVSAPVGRLDMPNEHIDANIAALLKLVESYKPKGVDEGTFVTQVLLSSVSSKEVFILKHWKYLKGYEEIVRPPITEWLKQIKEQQQQQETEQEIAEQATV